MFSALYINIKNWLRLYGADVLDHLLHVDHPEEHSPLKRYDNLDEQLEKHLGTSEHFEVTQGVEFPFLAIDISCDKNSKCFSRYTIQFSVYFAPATPTSGRVCIKNTPEDKLEYRESFYCAILNMLSHQVKTPKGIVRKTFADDMASDKTWRLPIRTQVLKTECPEDFSNELVDQVEMFSFPATLSVYNCL